MKRLFLYLILERRDYVKDKLKQMAKTIQPEFNVVEQNNITTLTLSGEIYDPWFESDIFITAKRVRKALDSAEGDIVIRLNSVGGDVFEGIEIYNYLKDLENHVTVEVTALAASAATFICMAADTIKMCTGSQMMVHNAWTYTYGNQHELREVADKLALTDNSIMDIYSERTGIDRETLTNYMDDETWFSAQEAVDAGLADSLKTKEKTVTVNIDASKLVAKLDDFQKVIDGLQEEKEKPKTGLNKIFGGKK